MIKTEIETLPENLLAEVFDFIQFLEMKREKIFLQKPLKNCQPPHLKRFGTIKRMLSMTVYKRGDVVLVPFPFSNQTDVKRRPAVIISSDAYNNIASDSVIMAITS